LASSPYVYSELVKWGEEFGISVSRPDGPTIKAVANGALAWHIDDTVSSRVSKFHYGLRSSEVFDAKNKEHQGHHTYKGEDGCLWVAGAWSGIVPKGTKIEAGKEFANSYTFHKADDSTSFIGKVEVYVYRRASPPSFITFPGKATMQPGFERICAVEADLEKCFRAAPTETSPDGKLYRTINFEVCISLGETEISARMRWKEDDVDVYGPAKIAYD